MRLKAPPEPEKEQEDPDSHCGESAPARQMECGALDPRDRVLREHLRLQVVCDLVYGSGKIEPSHGQAAARSCRKIARILGEL